MRTSIKLQFPLELEFTKNYVLKDLRKRHSSAQDREKVLSFRRLKKHLKIYNKIDDFKSFYTAKTF